MRKRIIALFLTFVTLLSVLVAPAVAAQSRGVGDAASYIVGNAWDLITGNGGELGFSQMAEIVKAFLGDGKTPETATETDWQNAYTSYTTNIQNNYNTTIIDDTGAGLIPLTGWSLGSVGNVSEVQFNAILPSFTGLKSYSSYNNPVLVFSRSKFMVPVSGSYEILFPSVSTSIACTATVTFETFGSSGNIFQHKPLPLDALSSLGTYVLSATKGYSFVVRIESANVNAVFSYIPSDYVYLRCAMLLSGSGDSFIADSRVGTFSGNFGYYGDGGQLTTAENISIVNETNNTYTNPATGQTSPISSWSYDYSDRSYKLNLEGGSTTTVTYGDEHVTIKEGDTVYNIYYMVPDSTTPDPTPSPSPSPSTPPTTPPTESPTPSPSSSPLPGPGGDGNNSNNHDNQGSWFGNIVISIGDIIGNIFGGGGGSGESGGEGENKPGIIGSLFGKIGELITAFVDGIVSLIEKVVLGVLDGIISLVNALAEKLGTVVDALFKIFDEVPAMFSGFTEFLTKVFAYIPPEIITIITFGILAVVLVAIFNAIRGR